MTISNYTDLQSSIADFLNRDDLTSVIPTFISLAEADMNRRLRHWRMEKRSTAVLNTQYSALPADFIEPIRLQIVDTPANQLKLLSVSEMGDLRTAKNTAGRPAYYTMIDGAIEVYPNPDVDYDLEMVYYSKIDSLASASTNWVLDYHPDAYLYGALTHSAPYLAEDARTQVWVGLFQNAIAGIIEDDQKGKYGGTGHRVKFRSF